MEVRKIISAFGGTIKLAKLLNIPATTVSNWSCKGRIPSWRIDAIKQKAKELNINLPLDTENQNK